METKPIVIRTPEEYLFAFNKFIRHVHVENIHGCWEWRGNVTYGHPDFVYGRLYCLKQRTVAHRWAWRLLRGEIPENYVIDHLCRNTLCVNPNHLEPVTHFENCSRVAPYRAETIAERRKDACQNGHPWTPESTKITKSRLGKMCKICTREARLRYDEKHRTTPRRKTWSADACPNGHPLSERRSNSKETWCKACKRERTRRWRAK